MKIPGPDFREWCPRIWRHHKAARTSKTLYPTSFWVCVKASVILFFGRCAEGYPSYDGEEIAWKSLGRYFTDYGEGQAWMALAIQGWRYYIYEDGSL